jgi:PAS domain S-box-containing protein
MSYATLKLRFPYSFVFALLISLIALAIEAWMNQIGILEIPFSLFYPTVFLTAWIGGTAAGLFATFLSILAVTSIDLSLNGRTFLEQIQGPLNEQRILLFILNCVLSSVLFGIIRRSFERANKAELSAVQSEDRFRQLAENIRDQVFYIMEIGRGELLYVSPAYEKVWRRSLKSLADNPKSFIEAIHPDDRQGIIDAIEKQREGIQTSVEYRLIHPNGDIAWILDRGFPVRGKDGKVERAAGIAEDITAEKQIYFENERITNRLIASEKKYRDLFDATPLPMWIVDEQTKKFLEVNEAACEKYGYSRDEFLNMTLMDIRPASEVPQFLKSFSEERTAFTRVDSILKHAKKDGSLMDVQIIAKSLEFEGHHARQAMITDVTEGVKESNELREAKLVAESASSAKSRFLANMSHEIRTPLGAVLGFAELLKDASLPPEERKYFIDTILRNGQQLSMVINDILDLSKIESNRMDIERVTFDPVEILEETAALLRLQAQAKGLELRVVIDKKLPHAIKTDPTRLRQILINLIGNSVKFTSQGSVNIEIRPVEGSADGRERLEFLVSDTGPGISDEHKLRLFQPFSQADSSTTRKFGGTGLGLALSKRLAEALNGSLELQSSCVGNGSAFSLVVDAGSKEELAEASMLRPFIYKDKKQSKLFSLAGMRILIVEDAPDNRVLIQRLLKPTGAYFECVENGVEGVNAALANKFDVVLMDIQMPKMDGFEAIHELRYRGYAAPVIALTAHAMNGVRERCIEAGFNGYLVKPINRDEMIEALGRYSAVKSELVSMTSAATQPAAN